VDTETPRPEKLLLDFDTTVNSSPTDISGQGNHGRFLNGASYSAADKAFSFDGSNDTISAPIVIAGGNMVFSESIWFKIDAFPSTSTDTAVLSFFGNAGGNTGFITGYEHNRMQHDFYGMGVVAATTFVVNQWYHVVVIYHGNTSSDPNVRSSIYINGVKQTLTAVLLTTATQNLPTSTEYQLARYINSGNIRHNGKISNPKLYSVVLEPSEVQKLYRLGRTGRSMVISDTAVGIGKVPEAQLDVRGRINATGSISSNNPSFSYWKIDEAGLEATVESPSGSQKAGFFQNFTQSFGQNHENDASAENRNSMFDPDSGTFHVPERGLYQLTFNFTMVDVSSSSGDETLEISFHISDNAPSEVRGTATDGTQKLNPALSTGSSLEEFWCLSECVRLETGASVRVYLKNIDTGNQFAVVKMNFSGFKIA